MRYNTCCVAARGFQFFRVLEYSAADTFIEYSITQRRRFGSYNLSVLVRRFGFRCGAACLLWRYFWLLRGAAFRFWRGFWVSAVDSFRLASKYFGRAAGGNSNAPTAAQQGAAPDRLQLRSLCSCLASVSALPAAGELGRWAVARGLKKVKNSLDCLGHVPLKLKTVRGGVGNA